MHIDKISKITNDVETVVDSIATAVETQSATTKEITENIKQTSPGITEVADNVAQSSKVAGAITKEIVDVNLATTEMSSQSNRVNQNADEIKGLAEKLESLCARFVV